MQGAFFPLHPKTNFVGFFQAKNFDRRHDTPTRMDLDMKEIRVP
jgi:hypothetical protein